MLITAWFLPNTHAVAALSELFQHRAAKIRSSHSSFFKRKLIYIRQEVNDLKVGIIMGSKSDLPVMEKAGLVCKEFGVSYELDIISAHRTPKRMYDYATSAESRGIEVIIAGAGGAAHLPGMTASLTCLPVIGVPVESKTLHSLDSLLSIVQMPHGVPVATVGINQAGNAALLAIKILALQDNNLRHKLKDFSSLQEARVVEDANNI